MTVPHKLDVVKRFLGYNYRIMPKVFRFRYWFAGGVTGILLIVLVAYQQQRASEKYAHHRAEYCAALVAAMEQKKSCIEETASARDYLPWGYELVSWPGGITTWAIILTGFTIFWQGWETRKAAEATVEAARASLLSAQALVNIERPWLIAEVVRDERQLHFYQIEIKNYGRTPARFLYGDAAHTYAQYPNQLPVPPPYSAPFIVPTQTLIAPGGSFKIPHGYNIPAMGSQPNAMLVIFGRAVYEDTLAPGIEHETRWCWGYVAVSRGLMADFDFVLTGPSEYSKYT
jgi:hypothetical protein